MESDGYCLSHDDLVDLLRHAHNVEAKRLELENARLRQEIAIRRVLDTMGLGGKRVEIDLETRHVRLLPPRADGQP